MKSSDKMILLGLALVGVLAGVWFLLIAPKREEASQLEADVAELQSSVATAEALASDAEAAESGFDESYSSMIRLGKAVPVGSDQASLIDQIDTIASQNKASFISLNLSSAGGDAAAATPAPSAGTTDASGAPVAATESSVALTPLGASVGPAGLATMPYELSFNGDFLSLADFFGQIDGLVHVNRSGVIVTRGSDAAQGRLLTINGFSLSTEEAGSDLTATVSVTSYLTPATEGLTAGATPAGPAVDPAAAETATAQAAPTTPTPTATVTP